jgi:hypothetical protein
VPPSRTRTSASNKLAGRVALPWRDGSISGSHAFAIPIVFGNHKLKVFYVTVNAVLTLISFHIVVLVTSNDVVD